MLTGAIMQVASRLTGRDAGTASRAPLLFFDWNVLLLFVCCLATVVVDGAHRAPPPLGRGVFALAPGVILCSLYQLGPARGRPDGRSMLAWSRARLAWPGSCSAWRWRRSSTRCCCSDRCSCCACAADGCEAFWRHDRRGARRVARRQPAGLPRRTTTGWSEFYTFSSTRGGDCGSLWYALQASARGSAGPLNHGRDRAARSCSASGIALRSRSARQRRPRLAQLAFLVVAAFASRTRSTRRSTSSGSSRWRRWPGRAGATS